MSPQRRLPASTVSLGNEFERHVVRLLEALNYHRVRHVGGAGDRGIDIVAEDSRGRTFLVQCKRYSNGAKVGSVDIQKLMGAVVHQGADGGIFVTTASYTPAAVDLARTGRVHIDLYDGRDVAHLSRRGLW
jgi:restriction system protein